MVKFSGRSDKGYEMVKDDLEELMTKAIDVEQTQSFGTHSGLLVHSKHLNLF
jgi:hypothetical protein